MTPLTRDDTEHAKMYYLASEVHEQLALAMGTLESRERNIETILEESARRQSEIERLSDVIQRAKQESELIEHKGKTMIAVPYWFMKS